MKIDLALSGAVLFEYDDTLVKRCPTHEKGDKHAGERKDVSCVDRGIEANTLRLCWVFVWHQLGSLTSKGARLVAGSTLCGFYYQTIKVEG